MSSQNSNLNLKPLADDYWNFVNRDTREKAFFAIMERLYKAIDDNKGYEDVFRDLGISIDGSCPSQSGFDVMFYMLKYARNNLETHYNVNPNDNRNSIIDELIR